MESGGGCGLPNWGYFAFVASMDYFQRIELWVRWPRSYLFTHSTQLELVLLSLKPLITGTALLLATALAVEAQTAKTDQPSARPYGLDIVGEVMVAGSDDAAAAFQQNALGELQTLINEELGERQSIADVSAMALDPAQLQLQTMSDVRVYFISEGAGYHNTLGFNTEASGIDEGNPLLIFPDSTDPDWVSPGDFVDLGTLDAGTSLDFFLIANGANGGSNIFTNDAAANPDGIQHVVSFALEGSPYLLIGFEDLFNGGDRDFNDLLFAVEIGEANVESMIASSALSFASPEPSTALILGSFCFFILGQRRRGGRR